MLGECIILVPEIDWQPGKVGGLHLGLYEGLTVRGTGEWRARWVLTCGELTGR